MPEHFHLLITEPEVGDPSVVMKVIKERFSRRVNRRRIQAAAQLIGSRNPEGPGRKLSCTASRAAPTEPDRGRCCLAWEMCSTAWRARERRVPESSLTLLPSRGGIPACDYGRPCLFDPEPHEKINQIVRAYLPKPGLDWRLISYVSREMHPLRAIAARPRDMSGTAEVDASPYLAALSSASTTSFFV